jgi:hypothetical protein
LSGHIFTFAFAELAFALAFSFCFASFASLASFAVDGIKGILVRGVCFSNGR